VVVRMWTDTADTLGNLIEQGRIVADAMTTDGDLHALDPATLPAAVIRRCIAERTPERNWPALHRHLRLEKAQIGRLVLNRVDLDRVLSEPDIEPV
jgi:hypothetical protein